MTTALNQRKKPRQTLVEKDPAVILQDFTVRQGDERQYAIGDDEKMYWYNAEDQKWYLQNS